jgi:site-specific DNA-methyltransferase (adenine-specific)
MKNYINNEDCIEGMKKIPSASIDMVLTDPPYTSPTVHAFGRQKVNRLSDLAIQEFYFAEIKKEWERILKPNAPVLIFCDDIYSAVLMGLFYEWQQKNLVIWDKGKIGMGNPFRKQHELVFYANRGSIVLNKEKLTHIPTVIKEPLSKEFHGAEKPIKLLEKLINGLTENGSIVLDCFMGSGSTAIACQNTGRNYIGFELDKSYWAIAQKRVEENKKELDAPTLFTGTN